MARRAAGHRRAKSFSEPFAALPVSCECASGFADPRRGGRTENLRRRYALGQKQLKFLQRTQRSRSCRQIRIKERLSSDQAHRILPYIFLLFLRRVLLILFRRRRVGQCRRIWLLLRCRCVASKNGQRRQQYPRTYLHRFNLSTQSFLRVFRGGFAQASTSKSTPHYPLTKCCLHVSPTSRESSPNSGESRDFTDRFESDSDSVTPVTPDCARLYIRLLEPRARVGTAVAKRR